MDKERDHIEPMRTCTHYCRLDYATLDFIHDRDEDDGFCDLKDGLCQCIGCICSSYQSDYFEKLNKGD